MSRTNRTFRDVFFRRIFNQQEFALPLCNALLHTEETDPSKVEVVTLEDKDSVILKNDTGIIFGTYLCLIEHQSTRNGLMPFRMLGYAYDEYCKMLKGRGIDIHSSSGKLKVPGPKCVVFYNGREGMPEISEHRLSDFFEGDGPYDIDVKVTFYNINYGYNVDLKRACAPLSEYMYIVERISDLCDGDLGNKERLTESIHFVLETIPKEFVLYEFLKEYQKEVENMLFDDLSFKGIEDTLAEERKAREAAEKAREAAEKSRAISDAKAEAAEKRLLLERKITSGILKQRSLDEIVSSVQSDPELQCFTRKDVEESIEKVKSL